MSNLTNGTKIAHRVILKSRETGIDIDNHIVEILLIPFFALFIVCLCLLVLAIAIAIVYRAKPSKKRVVKNGKEKSS